MSYRIRLEPSGHEFTALPQESLLEAALRSGINPRYNCSNGTCGDCRARVIQGQVGQHMARDFHFSERERAQGYVMLCATHAESDLVIQADEANSPREMPLQQVPVKLVKFEPVSDKVGVLQLRTSRSNTLRFMAGQYVRLEMAGLPPLDVSIASCPCNGMHLYFHLHRDSEHPLVAQLFAGQHSGAALTVHGPYGELSLDDDSPRPLLMVALGSDFAISKSLIEHAVNLELTQPLRLYWLADAATGHYLDNYCRSWMDVLDDYAFVELHTAAALPSQTEIADLLARLQAAPPALAEADIYLAGPESFTTACSAGLLKLGADPSRLFVFHRRQAMRG
ncbi:MAG: 2Fe-2S iron-sulfur cluster binding domain-containing protein [Chromatiales bacterium]|nr:2Fe-2S iron-sulfur cluster binding domain-containing protein [Chromatiales bacterium]